ncbi:MAG: hypothetical protein ACI9WO_002141 [Sphingobacteriales bacterium]|jgi:hypothetical protein
MKKLVFILFLCCYSISSSFAQIAETSIKKELRASILGGPGVLQKNYYKSKPSF